MLNKYNQLHEKLFTELVEWYNIHQYWARKPTYEKAAELRKALKSLRETEKQIMDEIQVVRRAVRAKNQATKEKNNERNNRIN
jgi:hypothetical protein